jgi:hypothetical protein
MYKRMSKLEIQKLVRITVQVLQENNLTVLDPSLIGGEESLCGKIAKSYFGCYEFKSALNISTWWKRS